MTRRPFAPTEKHRQTVTVLASINTPEEDIGKVVGCSHVTLRKYFKEELETARLQMKAFVVGKLYKNIQDNKEASIFFYLKTQHGWKEPPQELRHGGSDEAPAMKMELTHHVVDAGTAVRAAQILAATGIGFDSKDSGGTD